MSDTSIMGVAFITKAEGIILGHIAEEQFGVSELAAAMSMSRSSLLRNIKKNTNLSASQFIRQVRLQKGMEMLETSSMTVSEISYQVGFGSTSYFIKCFREQYGYPPGEVGKGAVEIQKEQVKPNYLKLYRWPLIAAISVMLLTASFLIFSKKDTANRLEQ